MVSVYYCNLEDYDKLDINEQYYRVKKIQVTELNRMLTVFFKIRYPKHQVLGDNKDYIKNLESDPIGNSFYERNKHIKSLKCPGNELKNKTTLKNEELHIYNNVIFFKNRRI